MLQSKKNSKHSLPTQAFNGWNSESQYYTLGPMTCSPSAVCGTCTGTTCGHYVFLIFKTKDVKKNILIKDKMFGLIQMQ
jgi:hypothetical protein